jgi:ketosteroid isomerase-like protein
MRHFLVAIALLSSAPGLWAQEVEEVSATVRAEVDRATAQTLNAMFASFESLDAEGTMAAYARHESVLHISDGRIIQTDTIKPYTARGFAGMSSFQVEWAPHSLQVLSPDIAVRTILLTFRVTPQGGEVLTSSGVQTVVFKRLTEGWRIVHDQRDMERG